MNYHFVNIETGEFFICEEKLWIKTLETAQEEGWDPDGTFYDVNSQYEEYDYDEDYNRTLYCYCMHISEMYQWDGSYTDRRDQVVGYEDTIYLVKALEGTGADADLVSFIEKGSFRICS